MNYMLSNTNKYIIVFNGLGMFKYPQYLTYISSVNAEIINFEEDNKKNRDFYEHIINENNNKAMLLKNTFFLKHGELESAFEIIMSLQVNSRVIGVLNLHEIHVKQAAVIAQLLDLPNIGEKAMECCTNKYIQRITFRELSPKFKLSVNKDYSFDFDFPIVVKPIDKHSSINVVKCSSAKELEELLIDYDEEIFLMEEWISGTEFSIESIVERGKIVFSGVTKKATNEQFSRHFVEIGHTVPATVTLSISEQITKFNETVVERLKFGSGVVHLEVKVDNKGQLYLIEVAARNPGDSIMALYNLAYGFSFEKAIVDVILDNNVSFNKKAIRFAREMYVDLSVSNISKMHSEFPRSKITELWNHEFREHEFVCNSEHESEIHEIVVFKQKCEEVYDIKNSYDRRVSILMSAPTLDKLDELTSSIQKEYNERNIIL